LEHIEQSRGKKAKQAVCDRGYRGKSEVNGTTIILPKPPLKQDNRYQRDKKRKQCLRRAAIEPIIGHLKSDFRLSRNFLKGVNQRINGCDCLELEKVVSHFFCPMFFLVSLFKINRAIAIGNEITLCGK